MKRKESEGDFFAPEPVLAGCSLHKRSRPFPPAPTNDDHTHHPRFVASTTRASSPLFKFSIHNFEDAKCEASQELFGAANAISTSPATASQAHRGASSTSIQTTPSLDPASTFAPLPSSFVYLPPPVVRGAVPAANSAPLVSEAAHPPTLTHNLGEPLPAWRPCACVSHPFSGSMYHSATMRPQAPCGSAHEFHSLVNDHLLCFEARESEDEEESVLDDEDGACQACLRASTLTTTTTTTTNITSASFAPASLAATGNPFVAVDPCTVPPAVLYTHKPEEMPFFHLAALDESDPIFQAIEEETQGMDFEPVCVLQVQHPLQRAQFTVHREALARETGLDNTRVLYHATAGNLFDICQNGLSCRFSRGGFFGRGIYFSDSALKAHSYVRNRDNIDGVKVLLRCRVALGRVKQYNRLHFERDLVSGPPGYHSVQGYISTGAEYAVYDDEHVLVTEILLYKCRTPGPHVHHVAIPLGEQLVFISRAVLAFAIRQLSLIVSHSPALADTARRLLLALVTRRISLEDFFREFSPIAGGPPPLALRQLLTSEMAIEVN